MAEPIIVVALISIIGKDFGLHNPKYLLATVLGYATRAL